MAQPHQLVQNDHPEIIYTQERHIACHGDDSVLGHPTIYLVIGESGEVECPYCDRLFKLSSEPAL